MCNRPLRHLPGLGGRRVYVACAVREEARGEGRNGGRGEDSGGGWGGCVDGECGGGCGKMGGCWGADQEEGGGPCEWCRDWRW